MPTQLPSRFTLAARLGGIAFAICFLLPGCAWMRTSLPEQADLAAARKHSRDGLDAMERGAWGPAGTSFARAVDASPNDEALRAQYASALWHQGDAKGAIRQMEAAVQLAQQDAGPRVRLGEMHLAHGNLDAAHREADIALGLDRQLAAAWTLRGDVQRQQGRLQPALDDYHRAVSLQDHNPRVQIAIAELHRQLGRPQRALSTLQALSDQYPPDQLPPEVCYLEGLCYQSLRRYNDAATSFASASRRDGPNVDLLYRLAESQFLAGRPADARLALDEALHLVPGHAPSLALQPRIAEAQRVMETSLR